MKRPSYLFSTPVGAVRPVFDPLLKNIAAKRGQSVMLVTAYIVIINIVAFALYGIDKQKARRHAYRISEAALLVVAFIGGSLGALLGMYFFHHKTRKAKFKIGVPLILLLHALLVFLMSGI